MDALSDKLLLINSFSMLSNLLLVLSVPVDSVLVVISAYAPGCPSIINSSLEVLMNQLIVSRTEGQVLSTLTKGRCETSPGSL